MLSQTSKCVILVEELRARLEDALHRLDPMRDYGAPTAASRHGGEPVAAHVADTQESLLLTNVINVQEVHEDLRDRVLVRLPLASVPPLHAPAAHHLTERM